MTIDVTDTLPDTPVVTITASDDVRWTLRIPEKSDWTCHLHRAGFNITWTPDRGQEPNAFHRLAQRLLLGVRWVRR